MNKEALSANITVTQLPTPGLEIISPGMLSPEEWAANMIKLLQSVYVEHGISKHPDTVVNDINSGKLKTWFAKKEDKFVATASLVTQNNGDVEIGRAVSKAKGAGKLLMTRAAQDLLSRDSPPPLVAEVRVAQEFWNIPSGEATQHICFDLLNLVPHAIAPFFQHGRPLRNESFVLARNDIPSGKTISELAFAPLSGRSMQGTCPNVKLIQTEPFSIVIPDANGSQLTDLEASQKLETTAGFTLFPIEATDSNLPLIGALLSNPRIILCGLDLAQKGLGKPTVLFGTIGASTKIAPTHITSAIAQPLRRDLQTIADRFTSLGNSEDRPPDFWQDKDGKYWGFWS